MSAPELDRKLLRQSLHDINNALNAMSMQAELSKLHIDDKELDLAKRALDVVLAECRRAAGLNLMIQRAVGTERA